MELQFAQVPVIGVVRNNVPIEDRFSATNPYAAIIFSEHYYDKRYNIASAIYIITCIPTRNRKLTSDLYCFLNA